MEHTILRLNIPRDIKWNSDYQGVPVVLALELFPPIY